MKFVCYSCLDSVSNFGLRVNFAALQLTESYDLTSNLED